MVELDARREALSVTLERRPVRVGGTLECLLAIRELVGERHAFMLESLSGPAEDTKNSLIGLTGLVEIAVHRGRVTIAGVPALAARLTYALVAQGIVCHRDGRLELVDTESLWQLARVVEDQFAVDPESDAFGFGLLAYYGYDAVRYIERLPRTIPDPEQVVPDAVFSLVHGLITIDLASSDAHLVVAHSDEWPRLDIDDVVTCVERSLGDVPADVAPPPVPAPLAVEDDTTEEEFVRRAQVCLEHIRVGDIYQVQIGHEITVRTRASHLEVYRRLRWRNPSPYMCLLPIAGAIVVGSSPELFIRMHDGEVTMRPIAGTARRHQSDEMNAQAVDALLADPKERAEHVMLVDLCRNDLGRIAEPMTVEVRDLMIIEKYSHMHHIVSSVVARCDDRYDVYDVIKATFPAGTMTGAPKVRAMEIIEALETSRRGLYAGAFGLIGFGGLSILGLAIRMAVNSGDRYRLRASAGIVADSDPHAEWRETATKLGATYWAVTGEEYA